MSSLESKLESIVGTAHVLTDPDVLAGWSTDWTGRDTGAARAVVRPGDREQVAEVLNVCRAAGAPVTIHGGGTSLVSGTVPRHEDVLLSTSRLADIGEVDRTHKSVRVGAGTKLNALRELAAAHGLLFGVDLSARDSATIGGMVATNAGGLHTVRYGRTSAQLRGLEAVLPDGSIIERFPKVPDDRSGLDLVSLFAGSEGVLGVVTAVEVVLRPRPRHRVAALVGFSALGDLVHAATSLRATEGIDALELLDGEGVALAAQHLGLSCPVRAEWLLLVELAGEREQLVELAELLAGFDAADEPAISQDSAGRNRLWQVRESFAEVTRLFGAPAKFDLSLNFASIPSFADEAKELLAAQAPQAVPILFGHIGDGNLHLNVLRCPDASRVFEPMLALIARHGGNISSEHGLGSLKRDYLPLARSPEEIAAMRSVKRAFDPDGYLNPAVLFPTAIA
ncbi:FAD linked oxidase domain protein [Segniliparus rotundus DSM 44985]|uniref:FAD linked oxidase domain protein n=1 Tax=Segniliparus rotundus (strain ATCC BAA-972 / CDC 1076 / CIP 108378 / DSM 44985 / JCM 13578) TaxID=640132 RepID=D6ZDD3_SEGRD|nr:FAD linked oxidase domain protein [Segniliparus rotundus DSM 44985]